MSENAKLTLPDSSIELPTLMGTEDEKAIDISALRGTTGYICLDNGYANTGAASSSIAFLNGHRESYAIEVTQLKISVQNQISWKLLIW